MGWDGAGRDLVRGMALKETPLSLWKTPRPCHLKDPPYGVITTRLIPYMPLRIGDPKSIGLRGSEG